MLTLFAVLSNANEWSEIEAFGIKREKWLRNYLELENATTKEPDIISIDGKTSCGSKRNDTDIMGTKALHTLNAYSNDYGMCIGQVFVDEKSNEILAAKDLLKIKETMLAR